VSDLPPTAPGVIDAGRLKRARLLRRTGIGILAAFVLAGAVGLFGIRTRTVSAAAGGYDISVQYPATDRPGQPIHWVVTVRHPGGFGGPVDISVTQSYLDILDMNDIEPSPSGSVTSGDSVVWTFDKPEGETLRVSIDALVQLNTHFGAENTVAVLDHAVPVVQVHYRTWVAP